MDTDYIKAIRHAFGNATHLARFVGVARVTVDSWCTGRRKPGAVEQRLLYVLGVLMVDAPALFDALVESERRTVYQSSKPPLPVLSETMRAIMRELPPVPPVPPRAKPLLTTKTWSDDYWWARSLSREEWDAGLGEGDTLKSDGPEVFSKMTQVQEDAYNDSFIAYLKRTGRIDPKYPTFHAPPVVKIDTSSGLSDTMRALMRETAEEEARAQAAQNREVQS